METCSATPAEAEAEGMVMVMVGLHIAPPDDLDDAETDPAFFCETEFTMNFPPTMTLSGCFFSPILTFAANIP